MVQIFSWDLKFENQTILSENIQNLDKNTLILKGQIFNGLGTFIIALAITQPFNNYHLKSDLQKVWILNFDLDGFSSPL